MLSSYRLVLDPKRCARPTTHMCQQFTQWIATGFIPATLLLLYLIFSISFLNTTEK